MLRARTDLSWESRDWPLSTAALSPGFWRHCRSKAMIFSGLRFGSTGSQAAYAQGLFWHSFGCASPHSAHPGVLPMAAAFCFLALLGDGSPAWHPSSCLHPSPSSCLGLVSWEGTKESSRAECKAGAGEMGKSGWVRAECICKALPPSHPRAHPRGIPRSCSPRSAQSSAQLGTGDPWSGDAPIWAANIQQQA